VAVWRKLQRFGALPLGNSGYLLPNAPENHERFEGLATTIRSQRGEASVVEVQSIDNFSTPQLTDLPSSAGMLATGGGLIFTGKLTGEFIALDEDAGKCLWQFKTGASVNSTAITYTHNGRQYVTIASGLGGISATEYVAAKVPAGGSIWTFALMPESSAS
jgi:outer membrane protein assembly factor BamB